MDMEAMAWDCLFGNLEEWIDEYGVGYVCRPFVSIGSQFEGSVGGILDIVGTIVECDDVYTYFLFESELWFVEEVL